MKKMLFLACIVFAIACNTKTTVSTIVYNAKIYTVDSSFSIVQAMAIKDGKIVALGTTTQILNSYTANDTINANNQIIYPGFIDAHAHFVGYGKGLFEVNLYNSHSWKDVLHYVADFAKGADTTKWIIGRGWDQNKFPDKQFPTNDELNKRYPNTPVLLTRIDGHAAIANNKALQLAQLQPNQTLIGGTIETKNGKLTGLLIDNAVDLITSKIPTPKKEDYASWLTLAQEKCFAYGLTTITDCGLMYNDVAIIDELQKENVLQIKLYIMLSDDAKNYNAFLKKGPYKTDKLFVNGFKIYADGALGSRGACLLKHYADKPNWQGFLLSNLSHFDSVANILSKTNFQMCTHAIGDSANRAVLNIYNKYLKPNNNKRWRIEHAQIVHPNDIALFASASIIPSVQPTHATSDMYWAQNRLGKERLETEGYAYLQLLNQNGWLPLGTDFPVEDISPFKTFLAAVYRKDAKGFPTNGFQTNNALSKQQALKGITIWAAKAAFLDKETGSLEIGKKADFIMLNNDLLNISETEVLYTKVLTTWVDGKKVFGN